MATLAIGVSLDQDQADPRLAIYLLAFATLSWTLASCALASSPARRQIGAGIAMIVLGGYAFKWTHHYLLPLARPGADRRCARGACATKSSPTCRSAARRRRSPMPRGRRTSRRVKAGLEQGARRSPHRHHARRGRPRDDDVRRRQGRPAGADPDRAHRRQRDRVRRRRRPRDRRGARRHAVSVGDRTARRSASTRAARRRRRRSSPATPGSTIGSALAAARSRSRSCSTTRCAHARSPRSTAGSRTGSARGCATASIPGAARRSIIRCRCRISRSGARPPRIASSP